jgi:hypothetical protein
MPSQFNPGYNILTTYFFEIQFNLILQIIFSSFQVDTCKISTPKLCKHILFPVYALCTQFNSPWFSYPNNRPDAYIKFPVT